MKMAFWIACVCVHDFYDFQGFQNQNKIHLHTTRGTLINRISIYNLLADLQPHFHVPIEIFAIQFRRAYGHKLIANHLLSLGLLPNRYPTESIFIHQTRFSESNGMRSCGSFKLFFSLAFIQKMLRSILFSFCIDVLWQQSC